MCDSQADCPALLHAASSSVSRIAAHSSHSVRGFQQPPVLLQQRAGRTDDAVVHVERGYMACTLPQPVSVPVPGWVRATAV